MPCCVDSVAFLLVFGCGILGVGPFLSHLVLSLLQTLLLLWACSKHGTRTKRKQFVDARIVNMLLAGYFAFIGAFALAATVDPILVQLLGTAVSAKG